MKQLALSVASMILASGMLLAQQPGTLDPTFGDGGRYTFAKAGNNLYIDFIDYREFTNLKGTNWGLLVGGNYSQDWETTGSFLSLITDNPTPIDWYGAAPGGFDEFYGGFLTASGEIFVTGIGTVNGTTKAHVGLFSGPGVLDPNFGSGGTLPLPGGTGNSYAFGISPGNPTSGVSNVFVVGNTAGDNYQTNSTCWMVRGNGTMNTEFGTNGYLIHNDGSSYASLWSVRQMDDKFLASGMSGEQAMFWYFDPATLDLNKLYYPIPGPSNGVFDGLCINYDNSHFFMGGYGYDFDSDQGNMYLVGINPTTLALEEGAYNGFRGLHEGLPPMWRLTETRQIEIATDPGSMKSTPQQYMIVAGTMEIGDNPETAFVTCINPDGTLRTDFGDNGFFVVDLEEAAYALDMVVTADGTIYLAVNAGSKGYVYRIFGYTDRSGIDDEILSSDRLEVYPNPTQGLLTLELNLTEGQSPEMNLLTLAGRRVKQQVITDALPGNNKITIDISDLPVGVYLVEVRTKDGVLNGRVVLR